MRRLAPRDNRTLGPPHPPLSCAAADLSSTAVKEEADLSCAAAEDDLLDQAVGDYLADATTLHGCHDRDKIVTDIVGAIAMTRHLSPARQRRMVWARYQLHRQVLDEALRQGLETAAGNATRRRRRSAA